jgi:hypothetical protein
LEIANVLFDTPFVYRLAHIFFGEVGVDSEVGRKG